MALHYFDNSSDCLSHSAENLKILAYNHQYVIPLAIQDHCFCNAVLGISHHLKNVLFLRNGSIVGLAAPKNNSLWKSKSIFGEEGGGGTLLT